MLLWYASSKMTHICGTVSVMAIDLHNKHSYRRPKQRKTVPKQSSGKTVSEAALFFGKLRYIRTKSVFLGRSLPRETFQF